MKYFILFILTIFSISPVYAQWQLQISGTSENLNDVAVLSQTTAIVVGENGTILKTTDNGLNWVAKNSGGSFDFNAVSFRDEQNGLAVGNGVLSRTTDGGESWSETTALDNLVSVVYRNPYFVGLPILIGSNNGKLLYSNDDGNSWNDTLITYGFPVVAVGLNYDSPSQFYPIAYAATTYRTAVNPSFPSNAWKFYENPYISFWDFLTGGDFYDENQYLVGFTGNPGPLPILLRRTDTDTTWEIMYLFVPPPYEPEDICSGTSSPNEILYVCGYNGKIFKSTNGGENWFEQYTNLNVGDNLLAISFWNNIVGYSVGRNGNILFTSNGGTSSVEEVQSPTGYYLFQNYPNPFNPSTNIEYEINSRSFVQLKIFDPLGKEIVTLVDEEKPAGSYQVEFNPAKINSIQASGIYFYQLSTTGSEGKSVQTKKMIYLK